MTKVIAIDLGGTKVEGILVNDKLKVIKKKRIPTSPKNDKIKLANNISDLIKELDDGTVKKIGFSIAGFIDNKGKWQLIHNIPCFVEADFKKLFSKLNKKIVVENDAVCLALSEARVGSAKEKKNVVGIILGTGVGGGIVIEGKAYTGSTGGAGHLGHMVIDPNGIKCGCGHKGHFESWCSGPNIIKRYHLKGGNKKITTLKEMIIRNDKISRNVMNETIDKLGIAFSNIIHTLSPDAIVLGGGVSNLKFYPQIRKATAKYSIKPLAKNTIIIKNKLGDSSGIYGAAILALEN